MASVLFEKALVVVRGGGDLASGAIYRLHRCGFPVVVTELVTPKLVRRTVSFGEAVYSSALEIEGITARLIHQMDEIHDVIARNEIPVVKDHTKRTIHELQPSIVVDARMDKQPLDCSPDDASLVIALGPGYCAGRDCHGVIETNRGHNLGRVIWQGSAEADTGSPGSVHGQTYTRVLRAPCDGYVHGLYSIGDMIQAGEVIATVNGQEVVAQFNGVLRGLVHPDLYVTEGMKIGDLDPRAKHENCFTISDKSLAIGGGVLEAILSAPQVHPFLRGEA